MPGGRPRAPVERKQLEGTWRADRDGPACDAVAAAGVPLPPPWLDGEALALWRALLPGLVARRVVGADDATSLAMLCAYHAEWRESFALLRQTEPGSKERYRLLVMAGMCAKQFDTMAARFGLNPSDRAKLRVAPAGPPRTPVAPRKR